MTSFVIHEKDHVAVALEDLSSGPVTVSGAVHTTGLAVNDSVKQGHKIALRDIMPGDGVMKYGVRIGHATREIRRGEWVHLHNLASDLDERSGTLDGETGAPTDTVYA